jgi:hypothetical protein
VEEFPVKVQVYQKVPAEAYSITFMRDALLYIHFDPIDEVKNFHQGHCKAG